MIHLFHGEDALTRREAIKSVMPPPGSDGYAAVSIFEGQADVRGIIEACNALPFLAEKRYVLVRNFLTATGRRRRGVDGEGEDDGSDAATEEASGGPRPSQVLRDYLPRLPETTVLILEESGKVPATSVIYKFVKANGQERECRPLVGEELARWIRGQFAAREAPVHPVAVQTLMAYVGSDLLLLEKEIEKLAVYAAGRTVQETDVAEMVASAEEAKVWSMIDAAAMGRADAAVLQLRRVLADSANPPLRTLGAIVNRFRAMLLMKELADQRLSDQAIARRTGQADWSIRNTRPLLRRFSLGQLKRVYERLLETDVALKRSPLDEKLTLELLVLDIANRNLESSPVTAAVD
ncbi:MAG: DNA polymerase III subunit delta [Chloroflexota bacterium]|nr:DNA polymerase III subunit delta [Chloroflexota bacterium]